MQTIGRASRVPVCAGEYPFTPDPATGRRKLRGFLDAGITFFLDLTEEWERIPYGPLARYDHLLREATSESGHPIEYRRLPIVDNDVPTGQRIRDILAAIDGAVETGHAVYVHCWGGVGRTGTVVGSYLVRRGAAE